MDRGVLWSIATLSLMLDSIREPVEESLFAFDESQLPWVTKPSEWTAIDDVRGGELSLQAVTDSRREEMKYIQDRGVYVYSTYAEAHRTTGRSPIGVRWVDTDKGSLIRSRLCAQEFRRKWEDAIFAGTPPLEAMRVLVSLAAAGMLNPDPLCVLVLDIKRAHFYAPSKRRVFINLPPEDPRSIEEGVCGELRFSMYGTRDAASNWEDSYSEYLDSIGYKKGSSSPCVFYARSRQV